VVSLLLPVALGGLGRTSPRLIPRNWLVVLLQINARAGSLPSTPLRVFNPLDVLVLVLAAVTFLGLWPALHPVSRIWAGIAVALPGLRQA
jgi:hypothetical protein